MTHLLTRGEQQARKYPKPWIPLEPGDLSNLDRLDRGMPLETERPTMDRIPSAPFWPAVVVLVVLLGFMIADVVGVW